MEGGGFDYLNAAGKPSISEKCRAHGARKVCFSCDGFVLRLDRASRDRDAEFAPGGLVVTDAPCIHIVDGSDSVVQSLDQPDIRTEVEGTEGLMHFTAAQGVGWDILVEVPSNRRSPLVAALQDTFPQCLLPPLDITQLVSLHYAWISQDLKQRLGLLVKGSQKEVRGRWRDEHTSSHSRKKSELEALRSRSRSREKRQQEKQQQAGARQEAQQEEEQLRVAREREAEERLQAQQQRIQEEQVRKELEAQAKAAAMKRTKEEEAEVARLKKEAAEAKHLQQMREMRELEAEQLEQQRQRLHEQDKQAHQERQDREREIHDKKERLLAERLEAEEAHRRELSELKAQRAEEERRQREDTERRYEQSQLHRTERQALSRQEERERIEILRDEAESVDLLRDIFHEVSSINTIATALAACVKTEAVERTAVEQRCAEDLGDIQWQHDRQYAHVCEVGRRRLMEEEERLRRLLGAKEEAALAAVLSLYLDAQEEAFSPLVADPLDSSDEEDDAVTPARDTPLGSAPPTVPRARVSDAVTVVEYDDGSPHRATQTPSYAYVEGRGEEEDTQVAHELAKLRKEIHHERELRDRTEERMAEHDRVAKHKARQLEERERRLLEQLAQDHAKRLDEVRTVLQPRVEKAESFEEADRLLRAMHEREEEWARREKEWHVQQADLERDSGRLRDELARVSELHWLCENDKAELRGRCEANEVEMASMRTTIDRADDRLRHILLEEQELLCKVEDQWKAKLAEAEAALLDTDNRLKRRLDERERHWLQQEKVVRTRCERAEKEKLTLLERVEALQHRTDAADRERKKLREELGAESQLASHRSTMEVRAARDQLEKERRRRVEAEEALAAANHEQMRLQSMLEDARLRSTQQLRDSQLVAAHHESELSRVSRMVPSQPTNFSVITALEAAARYGIMSQFQESFTELMHLFHFRRRPHRQQQANGLEAHNAMLRELLSLEEAKVNELERTVRELRRQRDDLSRGSVGFNDAVVQLVLREGDERLQLEAACRDELVDRLTAKRRTRQPRAPPQPPPPLPDPPAFECSGWLLACLEGRAYTGMQQGAWKQLYMWVEHDEGLLCYSPTDPRHGDRAPVNSLDLSSVVAVEIEMFVDMERPPPVGRYQQLGFYLEMNGGAKHRFCASTVPERTQWLDHLRRTVLGHSNVWSSQWDPKPYSAPPTPPRRHRPQDSRSRSRSRNRVGFLEHLSYLGM